MSIYDLRNAESSLSSRNNVFFAFLVRLNKVMDRKDGDLRSNLTSLYFELVDG